MFLLCYDGSADARAAIDMVAHTVPGTEATVVTVWEPFLDAMVRSNSMAAGWGFSGFDDFAAIDQASEQAARDTAAQGAEHARAAGLVAHARVARRHGTIADAILVEAAEVGAEVVVVGTRGRGDVKSFLLGSVSHHLVQHADRAVIVVPSRDLADHRREARAAAALRASASGSASEAT